MSKIVISLSNTDEVIKKLSALKLGTETVVKAQVQPSEKGSSGRIAFSTQRVPQFSIDQLNDVVKDVCKIIPAKNFSIRISEATHMFSIYFTY